MSKKRSIFFLFCIIFMVGCSLLGSEQIGDVPDSVRIKAIKSGQHTKEDVIRLLGSPSSVTLFEKESWLYIESTEQNRLFLPQDETARQVVKITFNQAGTVEAVKTYDLSDGKKVAFDSQITPVQGKDLSVIDEMIGNFGRFSTKSDRSN